MNKKWLKLLALVLALALVAVLVWLAVGLLGNPVSKWLCTRSARNFLDENHPGYQLERVAYSFKDGNYHAFATCPDSLDGDFSMALDWLGRVRYDTYESSVVELSNTRRRLEQDYRTLVDGILDSPLSSLGSDICFGDLLFAHDDLPVGEARPDYAIPKEELVLNGLYDIRALGARAGELTVYLDHEAPSAQVLAQRLLTIRDLMDRGGGAFRVIDLVIRQPKPETVEGPWEGERAEVLKFPYEDIVEEGLVERVELAMAAARAYYAEMDKEK